MFFFIVNIKNLMESSKQVFLPLSKKSSPASYAKKMYTITFYFIYYFLLLLVITAMSIYLLKYL